MSEAPRGLKDQELQKYYETLLDFYQHPGWKLIEEKMKELFDRADSVQGIEGLQALGFRQGQVDIIKFVVTQPAVTSAAYDSLLEDEADES